MSKQSGAEMMLRSLGLGEVLDMAKGLANQGTLTKILAFADALEDVQKTLKRIEERLDQQDATAPSDPGSPLLSIADRGDGRVSQECGTDGQHGASLVATGALNGAHGRID